MGIVVIDISNWLYISEYFCFFICKNHNAKIVILIINILAIKVFLSNIFLEIFAFLIVYTKVIIISQLSLLYI